MSAAAVWIKERDLSLRVPSFDGVYNAIVIQAKKGQTDVPRLVTDETDLLKYFTPQGTIKVGYDSAYYSALAVLQKTNKLWVKRVVSDEAGYGMVKVTKTGFVQANLIDPEKNEITFDVTNIVDGSNVITASNSQNGLVSELDKRVINIDGFGAYEVDSVNGQELTLTAPIDGAVSFVGTGTATVTSSADYATFDIAGLSDGDDTIEVANYVANDGSTVADLAGKVLTINNAFNVTVVSVAGTTATLSEILAAQGIDTGSGFSGRPASSFVVNGVVDGVTSLETGSLVPSGVTLAQLDGLTADFVFELDDGTTQVESVVINYSGVGAAVDLATAINNAQVADTASGVAPYEEAEVNTVKNPDSIPFSSNDLFSIYASDAGDWSQDLRIQIITDPVRVKVANAFIINVFFKDNIVVPVETFTATRVQGVKDGYGRNIYIDEVLKGSNYIRGLNNPTIDGKILPQPTAEIVAWGSGINYAPGSIVYDQITKEWYKTVLGGTSKRFTLKTDDGVTDWAIYLKAMVELKGGDDGMMVAENEMLQAVNVFANKNSYPMTLLLDGGNAVDSYQREMVKIVEKRHDCMAILSCPISAELDNDYINKIVHYRDYELNVSSSFAALFTCHVEITDKYNDRKLFVAPDGYAAASVNYSAANFEIWYPPAGYKRGKLLVDDTLRRFKDGEMDYLYDKGINPIRFYPGKGIAIWGQKTLQNQPSSLDRMNVRLLLVVIEPAIAEFLEDYLFDLNTDGARRLIVAGITQYMEGIKARNGVYDFFVVCDSTNNTPGDIDNHILNVDVFVKPVQSIEYINFATVITPTGLDFKLAQAAL